MKSSIFIFILGVLAAALVVAEEPDALSSGTFTAPQAGFNLDYSNDRMTARAIGKHTIDILGLFDPSDNGQSTRYGVSLDLENEDSAWSFEVTASMEF